MKRRGTRRKKTFFLKKKSFLIIFLSFLIVCVSFWFFFFCSIFDIKKAQISLVKDSDQINEIITRELQTKSLFIFKRKNLFLFRKKRVINELLKQIPRIKNISIRNNFSRYLLVNVKEREAVLILCNNDCYLVDEDRIIFEKGERDDLSFVFVNDDIFIPKEAMPEETFSQIMKIDSFLREKLEIEIGRFILEKKFILRTKEGWEIYFDLEQDIELSLLKLKLLLEKEIENTKSLEYIDLRFSKVYYK